MSTKEEEVARRMHGMAHELAEIVMQLVDMLSQARGGLDIHVVLYGLEMCASLARRRARDAGVPKDAISEVRRGASQCALELLKKLTAEPRPPLQVQAVTMSGSEAREVLELLLRTAREDAAPPDPDDLPN